MFLEILQNSQECTCARDSFQTSSHICNFIEKECLAQVLSCKLCEISKNTFFYRTPRVAASCFGFHWKAIVSLIFLKTVKRNITLKNLVLSSSIQIWELFNSNAKLFLITSLLVSCLEHVNQFSH